LIAILTSSFIDGVMMSDNVPESVKSQASVQLAGGVPFLSDADLEAALKDAGATPAATKDIMAANRAARIDALHASLAAVALMAAAALLCTGLLPKRPPGVAAAAAEPPPAAAEPPPET
jgi:hypothetical protein